MHSRGRQSWDAEAGWTVVPGLLAIDEVAAVLEACERLCELPEAERRPGDKPHAGTCHLVDLYERIPLLAEVVKRPALREVLQDLLGAPHTDQRVTYRSPQAGFGSQYLHTDDVPKLDAGPDRGATAIVALTNFTKTNGATRLVPGSHRRPDLQRLAGGLDRHTDELRVELTPGDALVFSAHLLHSGTTNESANARPALQITWRTDA